MKYGMENVAYLIDNNKALHGTKIGDLEVKPVSDALNDGHKIIICSANWKGMEEQLLQAGCTRYEIFQNKVHYYPTSELVYNPYVDGSMGGETEDEWIKKANTRKLIDDINLEAEYLYHNPQLFTHVEIETINRCNGNCDFCPVSKKNDTREYCEMSQTLFENIINQLASINYQGRIALFSNNEPFLDERILERHKYARQKLPNAYFYLFTNGTLLNVEKFQEIVSYLDELIIDNYQQDLQLIKPCQSIVEYCKTHEELKEKVTIVLRKPYEILTSRGGDAPNRVNIVSYPKEKCTLPFKQLIIRPDGKVSLCCNDPLGKNTLGDLQKDTIIDIWNNDRFKMVRKCLVEGRENWNHCKNCDTFMLG